MEELNQSNDSTNKANYSDSNSEGNLELINKTFLMGNIN